MNEMGLFKNKITIFRVLNVCVCAFVLVGGIKKLKMEKFELNFHQKSLKKFLLKVKKSSHWKGKVHISNTLNMMKMWK